MELSLLAQAYLILFTPLLTALIVGLASNVLSKRVSSLITISGVVISCLLSVNVIYSLSLTDKLSVNASLYTWSAISGVELNIGILLDRLSAVMLVLVTTVSLLVHIYSTGYMEKDRSYNRFFAYISFFTFSMLLLVLANNFLQLFIGWESVGLSSYLLIGFWFQKESAVKANLKAFLVNRVGDFGLILGVGLLLVSFESLDYSYIFSNVAEHTESQVSLAFGINCSLYDLICILLFIGAMAKSAQIPLHVWLPDSMEGPTPISALIHAATMVTAGIFMVVRVSPIFEYATLASHMMLYLGAATALLMGLVAIVQEDIKRIIAYSTLSQLGYMVVALGGSAYSLAMFHLVTHAFFKALLFLGAGSIIIAMHHEQNIWRMGGLANRMPLTCFTMLLASLSLMGVPFFAGFYSKDLIIHAVENSALANKTLIATCLNLGVSCTAFYTTRLMLVVFGGKENRHKLHKVNLAMQMVLLVLALPAVLLGYALLEPFIVNNFLLETIFVLPVNETLSSSKIGSAIDLAIHSVYVSTFYYMLAGSVAAVLCYKIYPKIPEIISRRALWLYKALEYKYGFDLLYENIIVPLSKNIGYFIANILDKLFIDGLIVNGIARLSVMLAGFLRKTQTGYFYNNLLLVMLTLLSFGFYMVIF